MSGSITFDRHALEQAFHEVESVRRVLPTTAMGALAEEVVSRVARNLSRVVVPELAPTTGQIDRLCAALLSEEHGAALAFIEEAQRNGSSYEALCDAYLGVAAQRMGEWWEKDQVSFYRVTIAAGRIYAILRVLRMSRPVPTPDLRRSAIFASVPGENHTLGITIATDMARSRGWDIELLIGQSHDELVDSLEQRKSYLVGLSASGKRSLPALTKLIVALRLGNPAIRIMVCGQIASANVNLVGVTGADAAATDFESALGHMERLLRGGSARLI